MSWVTSKVAGVAAIVGGVLALALLILLLGTRAQLAEARQDLADEQAASRITVANYRIAAAKAEIAQRDNIARVQAEQTRATEGAVYELETRLADSDVRYQRLQRQAQAYSGTARPDALSAAGEAACLAYAGARCDAIPALLKAAQDNTDQLIALQAWVTGQAAIDFDPANEADPVPPAGR